MRTAVLAAALLVLVLGSTAACTSVTDGTGQAAAGPFGPSGSVPSGSVPGGSVPGGSVPGGSVPGGSVPGGSVPGGSVPSGSVPSGAVSQPGGSGSGAAPAGSFTCPHIDYALARMTFDCLTTGMTLTDNAEPFPLAMIKQVESVGWQVEEAAADYGAPQGKTLAQITAQVRNDMVSADSYGTSPAIKTLGSSSAPVGGVAASTLQSSFTINPAYRAQRKLKVKVERSWIVAMQAGPDDVKLWVATVPDDVSSIWASVPAIIRTIHLT